MLPPLSTAAAPTICEIPMPAGRLVERYPPSRWVLPESGSRVSTSSGLHCSREKLFAELGGRYRAFPSRGAGRDNLGLCGGNREDVGSRVWAALPPIVPRFRTVTRPMRGRARRAAERRKRRPNVRRILSRAMALTTCPSLRRVWPIPGTRRRSISTVGRAKRSASSGTRL